MVLHGSKIALSDDEHDNVPEYMDALVKEQWNTGIPTCVFRLVHKDGGFLLKFTKRKQFVGQIVEVYNNYVSFLSMSYETAPFQSLTTEPSLRIVTWQALHFLK